MDYIKILNSYLSPLGLKVRSHKDRVFNIIDRNGNIIICTYNNRYINMYWSNLTKMLLDLHASIVEFDGGFNTKTKYNPYYGCTSTYEMNIKKDLISI